MNKRIINFNSVSKLDQILNYQISTVVLFAMSFFYGILLFVLGIAAVLFTPYMIYVLYNEKRFGYIISYGIMIISPLVFFLIIGPLGEYLSIASMLSLSLFYFYCFLLKYSVREWLNEYRWRKKLEEQRKESEVNKELWEMRFEGEKH
jgi:hypothetical protein